MSNAGWHATTILCVRRFDKVVIAGDGQVSLGPTVVKSKAVKIRTLYDGKIITGFAGSTADAFTLFERLEQKLEKHSRHLLRASVELAKDWRTDKYLRKLEAMLIVADKDISLIVSGSGDVLEPEGGIASIGSGSISALSAARALYESTELSAEEIVRKSMAVAAEICVYTNNNITVKVIES